MTEANALAAPGQLRKHGLRATHNCPRVGFKREDGSFWSGRKPAASAWRYPYIDYQDAGACWATLTLDCDNRQALGAGLCDLPPPNWLIRTDRGAHITWTLLVPVAKHERARNAPIRYLDCIAEFFRHAVGADPAFSGMGRNPVHPSQTVDWGPKIPYQLDALSSVIWAGWKRPRVAATGIGRNVDLFKAGMRWAGCATNRNDAVLRYLQSINANVADNHERQPLPDEEVRGIAKSVERYRLQWQRIGWHKPAFRRRQADRGRLSGQKRRADIEYRDLMIWCERMVMGWSAAHMAALHGYSLSTVKRALRRGKQENRGRPCVPIVFDTET